MKIERWVRKLAAVFCFLGLVAFVTPAFGAAECVVGEDEVGEFKVITFTWTAHTDGVVASGTCDEVSSNLLKNVSGMIIGVMFYPHATNPPTNLYDLVLNNAGGADILHGVGANLTNDDANTGQWKTPFTTDGGNVMLLQENLDLVITNAGSANEGKLVLFLY